LRRRIGKHRGRTGEKAKMDGGRKLSTGRKWIHFLKKTGFKRDFKRSKTKGRRRKKEGHSRKRETSTEAGQARSRGGKD